MSQPTYPRPGQAYTYGIRPKSKRSFPRWLGLALCLAAVGLFFSVPTKSQLNQSGGPGNLTQVGGAAISLGQNTMANSLPVAIASNQSAISVAQSGTWTVGLSASQTVGLAAGTNLIGYSRAQNACGTTNYEAGMQNPPTSSTSLTATATCVAALYVSNTTASAATITIQDQGTGCNSAACIWIDAFSVPANSNMLIPLYGMKFSGGIKWSQGTANAISADVLGNQ
jgi:hypothetical protein